MYIHASPYNMDLHAHVHTTYMHVLTKVVCHPELPGRVCVGSLRNIQRVSLYIVQKFGSSISSLGEREKKSKIYQQQPQYMYIMWKWFKQYFPYNNFYIRYSFYSSCSDSF